MHKAVVGLTFFLLAAPVFADKKLDDRMMHAASILQEIRGSLEEDPPGVLEDAYAVAIFPEFVKVGLLGGVKHGRGVLAARQASGSWSKPAFVRITSGSIGLQFGVSMSQLLIVFKDPKSIEAISGGQFALGADAGYAAGTIGGSASAGSDGKLQNRTVAMARSKGLFAGAALDGGVLRIEKDSNVKFYNDAIGLDGRTLLADTEVELPRVAQHFLIVLDESVPSLREEADPISWGEKALDNLDAGSNGNTSSAAQTDARDAARQGTESAPLRKRAANGGVDLTQPPSQAVASAPGSYAGAPGPYAGAPGNYTGAPGNYASVPVTSTAAPGNYASAPAAPTAAPGAYAGGGAAGDAWIAPDGAQLPAGNTAFPATSTPPAYSAPATSGAANWVSPGAGPPMQEGPPQYREPSLASRLTGKIVGKVTDAAVDGAKELALESIRNKPEVKGAKVAAKVGTELLKGGSGGSLPSAPPRMPTSPPVAATAANNGVWVEPVATPASLTHTAPLSGTPNYPLTPNTPESLPTIASAPNANFTGPPSPAEWPQEWREAQRLGGICEPVSLVTGSAGSGGS